MKERSTYVRDVIRHACGQIDKRRTARELAAKPKKKDDDAGTVSPKVRNARDLFNAKCFKGGGHGAHAGDTIGQLWLLGKLDTPEMDETRLLNAARTWWHGRGIMFKDSDYKTARYERASRTSSDDGKLSRPEKDYVRYDRMLADADHYDQECLASLMETPLDGLMHSWVSRIIQTEMLKHVRLPVYELACTTDYDKLAAAKRALLAMAGVEALRRAA